MSKRYPVELRERAVRLVQQTRGDHSSTNAAIKAVAVKLGVGTEGLRTWVRQADVDEGNRPGTTTAEPQRIKELERENRELKRANQILKAAASFFAAEIDRPHTRS
ncbi:transposase [Nocardiopsis rhodophaea]|uniref:Transposase n=1 Tax=Nocardiopsis rhodophaea TaxID=280238 RepID=A0ABP5F7S7_9ACTN